MDGAGAAVGQLHLKRSAVSVTPGMVTTHSGVSPDVDVPR